MLTITTLHSQFVKQLFEQQVKKTKTVRMIFSNGSTKESDVKRNYKPTISRPKILHEYNQNYSTIDKLDQLTYYMRFPHRCQKWTTCMFIYCIHICILQAHSLFCLRLQRQISIIDFMLLLIDAIQPHTHTQIIRFLRSNPSVFLAPELTFSMGSGHIAIFHFVVWNRIQTEQINSKSWAKCYRNPHIRGVPFIRGLTNDFRTPYINEPSLTKYSHKQIYL
ncbi:Transposase_IS4 [Hexamita inflata]|uniref:Transposase IS4 n=1 Tax=Hexamita inflata TaxID=28002 RepID=A0AA86NRK3_9EUKA|nr:Transposase IS4 [Hexamita inflata]